MGFEFSNVGYEILATNQIDVPERLRVLDGNYVDAILASIREKGQLQPIEVAANPRKKGLPYVLVAGAHRLAACTIDGRPIACVVVKFEGKVADFNAACKLREVDENLIRQELNPLDRAVFLHTRKTIYEEMYPDTRAGVAGGKGATNEIISFVNATAEKIGIGPRTIQRACKIAESISPELRDKLNGTAIAQKEGELYNLAKQGPAVQKKIVAAVTKKQNPALSVMAALKQISGAKGKEEDSTDADDIEFKRLLTAFRKTPAPAQKRFLAFLQMSGDLDNVEQWATEYNGELMEASK